jgi:transcriptional regulator with GAF, ATPase, and Fis domain
MPAKPIPLKRLLHPSATQQLLDAFSSLGPQASTLAVADADCGWLFASPLLPEDRSLVRRARDARGEVMDDEGIALPLVVQGALYGVVYGDRAAAERARVLLQVLAAQIDERLVHKALARETLDRYREINLLYRIHETIGASLDLDEVIRRVLTESTHTIQADGGSVLLPDELTGQLEAYGSAGLDVARAEYWLIDQALSTSVFRTGKSRILNDVQKCFCPSKSGEVQLTCMLCSPLKANEQVLGVITLARIQVDAMFTAGDVKLLNALASQAGIAIANAKQVREREQRLRQQIAALRIEIDEARKKQEVFAITESEYFRELQENARKMRAEFED